MARRIVALILGLSVLGIVIALLYSTKEAGVEVHRDEAGGDQAAALPVRIVATSDDEITVDGRPVELAALADEFARLIAAAEEASLPDPSFIIAVPLDSDNAILIAILEALAEAGAGPPSIETLPDG